MKVNQSNLVFVIVQPTFLGNIGSVARAMKNFGFTRLRFVNPPENYKDSEARRMAVGAFEVLKHCEVFPDLDSALKDVSFSVGTCAEQYRKEKFEPLSCATDEIIKASQNNKVACVFGGERNGLKRSELERCHRVISIPTCPDCPSMNVSHAIAVISYEMIREDSGSPADNADTSHPTYPTGQADDQLIDHLGEILDIIGFSRSFNRDNLLTELRALYMRISPTTRERDLLDGIFHRIKKTIYGPDRKARLDGNSD